MIRLSVPCSAWRSTGAVGIFARLAEAAPPQFLSACRGAMRFVVSCERCKFKGDATDICGLGAQINSHASTCSLAPLIVLEGSSECCTAEMPVEGRELCTTFVE